MADRRPSARTAGAEDPDLVLRGAPQLIAGVLAGMLRLDDACSHGLSCDGDRAALERLQPQAAAA